MKERETKTRGVEQSEIDERVRSALAKRKRGHNLTDYEWMIVQYALGGACQTCRTNHD